MIRTPVAELHPWKEDIFGCCSDMSICCQGCFCTSCLFGKNVQKVSPDRGFCGPCCGYCLTIGGCCCIMHRPARRRFREAYSLEEGHGAANDCCASYFCSCCGICQEAREIKVRGALPTTVLGNLTGGAIPGSENKPRTTLPATGALVTQPR